MTQSWPFFSILFVFYYARQASSLQTTRLDIVCKRLLALLYLLSSRLRSPSRQQCAVQRTTEAPFAETSAVQPIVGLAQGQGAFTGQRPLQAAAGTAVWSQSVVDVFTLTRSPGWIVHNSRVISMTRESADSKEETISLLSDRCSNCSV